MPSDNNAGERGALTQPILMTIFRTLKQRGIQPIDAILTALAYYNQTGQLPPLHKTPSNG